MKWMIPYTTTKEISNYYFYYFIMEKENKIEQVLKIGLAIIILTVMFIPLCLYAGTSIIIMLLKHHGKYHR